VTRASLWVAGVLFLCSCREGEQETVVEYDDEGRILVYPTLVSCPTGSEPEDLRIATWNIAAAQRGPLEGIAEVIQGVDADVIALQEVDVETERSGGIDQARWLAAEAGYEAVFAEALPTLGGAYGIAVLSRVPVSSVQRRDLRNELSSEPRIMLDVSVCVGGREVRVVTTHVDYLRDAAEDQVGGMGLELGEVSNAFLVGDLNLEPGNDAFAEFLVRTGLGDVFVGRDEGPTRGQRRIDYVLASEDLVGSIDGASRVESSVSDHHLLVVDVRTQDE